MQKRVPSFVCTLFHTRKQSSAVIGWPSYSHSSCCRESRPVCERLDSSNAEQSKLLIRAVAELFAVQIDSYEQDYDDVDDYHRQVCCPQTAGPALIRVPLRSGLASRRSISSRAPGTICERRAPSQNPVCCNLLSTRSVWCGTGGWLALLRDYFFVFELHVWLFVLIIDVVNSPLASADSGLGLIGFWSNQARC